MRGSFTTEQELKELKRRANGGDAEACFKVGHYYYDGKETPRDSGRAYEYFYLAEKAGHILANHYKRTCSRESGYFAETRLKDLAERADSGDTQACFDLALKFYEGDEVPQDSNEALFYFLKAQNAGNALASYYLGLCYYYGQGVQVDEAKARKLFESAVKRGCKEAEEALATLPSGSRGEEFNEYTDIETLNSIYYDGEMNGFVNSREWYEEAAAGGDLQAMFLLSKIYFYGWRGAEKDEVKSKSYEIQAYESAKRAFEKDGGDIRAKFWLGKCLYLGHGCEADKVRGKELISEASDAGFKQAQLAMVGEYIDEDRELDDSPRLKELLERLGKDGNAGVKRKVAGYFRDVRPVRDAARSEYWYIKSAEEGSLRAQTYLAEEYFKIADRAEWLASRGEDREQNLAVAEEKYKKSFYWFGRAAESGFIFARYHLAKFYFNGIAVEKDYAKAYELLLPVAKITHGDRLQVWKGDGAACMIGDIYARGGYGVERDDKKSFDWYMSAARRENMRACTAVGNAYLYGIGTEVNYGLAVSWFEDAVFDYDEQMFNGSDKGYNYGANVGLGDCYRLGLGVKKDEYEAFRLYDDVSKYTSDCPAADERVARCYYFGTGVEKDIEKAQAYWQGAAENGDGDAKKALKEYFGIDA